MTNPFLAQSRVSQPRNLRKTAPRGRFARGLYLLTPDLTDTAALLAQVTPLLAHVQLLQYRNKAANAALREQQARALVPMCRAAGVPLIINDDIALAARIGADGVHLGENDDGVVQARAALGADGIIGASCYNDLARARYAASQGADYIAFGAFFATTSKPTALRADPQLLRDAVELGLPLVAIGGITPGNAPTLIAAGAQLLAVISGVFDAKEPTAAAYAYAALFDQDTTDCAPSSMLGVPYSS